MRAAAVLAAALFFAAGCSTGPYSARPPLEPDIRTLPYLPFSYRLPAGWSEVATPPDSAGILLWLVRGDFAGAIDLREMRLDAEAGMQMTSHGLRPVADLARSLAGTTAGVMPTSVVEEITVGGRRCYVFEQLAVESGDTTRVVVFEAAGRVFMLNSLAVPGAGGEVRRAVNAAQEAFLAGLQ